MTVRDISHGKHTNKSCLVLILKRDRGGRQEDLFIDKISKTQLQTVRVILITGIFGPN